MGIRCSLKQILKLNSFRTYGPQLPQIRDFKIDKGESHEHIFPLNMSYINIGVQLVNMAQKHLIIVFNRPKNVVTLAQI